MRLLVIAALIVPIVMAAACAPREVLVLGDPGRHATEVTVGMGQPAYLQGHRVRPLEVVEDSRCPFDVQCIHAGFFRARVEIHSPSGEREEVLELGRGIALDDARSLTICRVTPERLRSGALPAGRGYRVTFCMGPGD